MKWQSYPKPGVTFSLNYKAITRLYMLATDDLWLCYFTYLFLKNAHRGIWTIKFYDLLRKIWFSNVFSSGWYHCSYHHLKCCLVNIRILTHFLLKVFFNYHWNIILHKGKIVSATTRRPSSWKLTALINKKGLSDDSQISCIFQSIYWQEYYMVFGILRQSIFLLILSLTAAVAFATFSSAYLQ